ncbi:MAG: hypothetical protein ABID79_05670 [Elusimicrobiota bacterium]
MVGSGWEGAALIETGEGSTFDPQIAMNVNGNGIAVWKQYNFDRSKYSICANRYVVGTGWGTAQLIENTDEDVAPPQIAMDNNGNGIAVWEQSNSSKHSIWANIYR